MTIKSKNSDQDDEYVKFQLIDWRNYQNREEDHPEFEIRLFGMTDTKQTIYVNVWGFKPFFYVKIPRHWRLKKVNYFVKVVKKRVKNDKFKEDLVGTKVVDAKIFREFDDYAMHQFVKFEFNNTFAMRAFEYAFAYKIFDKELAKRAMKYEVFETNAEPMLRCMHIQNIDACGWVKVKKKFLKEINGENKSHCNLNYKVKYNKLERMNSGHIQPFKIASFDIECTSEDTGFPQPKRKGDKIIQIGTTFNYYGESNCYRKHIITLGSCDPIPGTEVVACKKESEVLLEWLKLIQESDPDIITGYNIIGFDFNYMYERSKLLDKITNKKHRLEWKFSHLSRIVNELAPFTEKKLSSSALGDNFLKYYDMGGRVVADLMKVVQRDFKLPDYKLDTVASWFIRDSITNVTPNPDTNSTIVETKGTFGLDDKQYVAIHYKEGYLDYKFMKGKKFVITDITKKSFRILDHQISKDDFNSNGSYFWTQAKDDVGPKDIFRLQKGSSKDRAKVAKYCIQDCVLVNKLMAKLQVITNGVGMANVSNVPISYLFMRGQGVKIFSLMLKECSTEGFIMPVVKRKNRDPIKKSNKPVRLFRGDKDMNDEEVEDNDDDDPEGYEGATVFDPDKGVHYEPIPVLDYSSLYPSSMIHRNISHDCLMTEERYQKMYEYGRIRVDKLMRKHNIKTFGRFKKMFDQNRFKLDKDGQEYKDIKSYIKIKEKYYINKVTFRGVGEKKDEHTNCYYVRNRNGEMGVVPNILNKLLKTRKATKKKMAAETDPFLASIWDGLQLAYKLTANSLYGQCGAPTSAIYKREVAASTTATGREMLTYARDFTERIFHKVVEMIVRKKKRTYTKYMNQLFDRENVDKGISLLWDSLFGETWIDESRLVDKKGRYKDRDTFIDWFYKEVQKVMGEYRLIPKVMYGDSVTENTPLIIKDGSGLIKVITIDELFDEKKATVYHKDKTAHELNKVLAWTEKGWTKINKIIKHKTTKKIYRVLTHTGCIDVTEDHSLVDENSQKIKPTECTVGTKLLQSFPDCIEYDNSEITNEEAWVMGFFMADGSCNKYPNKKYGMKYSWAINNTNLEYLNKAKKYLETIEDQEFKILDTMKSSNVYKLVPVGEIKNITLKYRGILYHKSGKSTEKIVPNAILNAPKSIKESFWKGYYVGDGDKDKYGYTRCDAKNMVTSQTLYRLMIDLGYNVSINTRKDKPNVFRLTGTYGKVRKVQNAVKKMYDMSEYYYKDQKEIYVYDLETENHHFQGGIGNIVAHNTDSVFVKTMFYHKSKVGQKKIKYDTDHHALEMGIEMGILSGILINMLMPVPHDLEYEKTFWPFIIITKKRYVGNLYEYDPNKFKEKSMGIVLKRRDNAPVVKLVVGGIVNKILNERSGQAAVEFLRKSIENIMTERYKIDKFVISKTLKGFYKDRTKITHAVLADKIEERDPGNKPQSNDRIPYVFIEPGYLTCKISGEPVNIDNCKCRTCGGMFSEKWLEFHENPPKKLPKGIDKSKFGCVPRCRLTKETDPDNLIWCNRCLGYYQKGAAYFRHLLVAKTDTDELGAEIVEDIKNRFYKLSKINGSIVGLKDLGTELREEHGSDKWLVGEYNPLQLYYAVLFAEEYYADQKIFVKHMQEIKHYVMGLEKYQYLDTETGCKNFMPRKILQGDRAETPNYVLENGLSVDYLYYVTNQIEKPALQFLELVIKEPKKLFDNYEMIEQNRRLGRSHVMSFKVDTENKGMTMDKFEKPKFMLEKKKKRQTKKTIKKATKKTLTKKDKKAESSFNNIMNKDINSIFDY